MAGFRPINIGVRQNRDGSVEFRAESVTNPWSSETPRADLGRPHPPGQPGPPRPRRWRRPSAGRRGRGARRGRCPARSPAPGGRRAAAGSGTVPSAPPSRGRACRRRPPGCGSSTARLPAPRGRARRRGRRALPARRSRSGSARPRCAGSAGAGCRRRSRPAPAAPPSTSAVTRWMPRGRGSKGIVRCSHTGSARDPEPEVGGDRSDLDVDPLEHHLGPAGVVEEADAVAEQDRLDVGRGPRRAPSARGSRAPPRRRGCRRTCPPPPRGRRRSPGRGRGSKSDVGRRRRRAGGG